MHISPVATADTRCLQDDTLMPSAFQRPRGRVLLLSIRGSVAI